MKILVLGGRGYLGSAVCENLDGQITTFDRKTGHNHAQGTIESITDLNKACKGKDVVINLIGLTPARKPKKTTYEKIHVKGVRNLILACEKNQVKKLIHISAIGADKRSNIEYLRTKGKAEELLCKTTVKNIIIRPSIIFDTKIIQLIRKISFTIFFPRFKTLIQPVYRRDVAKLIAMSASGKVSEQLIEIGGPELMTVFDFVKKIYNHAGFPCIPLPLFFIRGPMIIASGLSLFGLSMDQIRFIDHQFAKCKKQNYVKVRNFSKWLKE